MTENVVSCDSVILHIRQSEQWPPVPIKVNASRFGSHVNT